MFSCRSRGVETSGRSRGGERPRPPGELQAGFSIPAPHRKNAAGPPHQRKQQDFCWLFVLLFIYGSRTQVPVHAPSFPSQLINLSMTGIIGTF